MFETRLTALYERKKHACCTSFTHTVVHSAILFIPPAAPSAQTRIREGFKRRRADVRFGLMKRRDLLRHLEAHGCRLEGGKQALSLMKPTIGAVEPFGIFHLLATSKNPATPTVVLQTNR